jgi:hypothetical protein
MDTEKSDSTCAVIITCDRCEYTILIGETRVFCDNKCFCMPCYMRLLGTCEECGEALDCDERCPVCSGQRMRDHAVEMGWYK